jgi:two-component system phosphate regulon sensor histidine kinase PhoR
VSALKSDFVANVSHELKTPLSLIRLFGELLLLERAESPEKKRKYLSIIVGESERLTALIENVLDFARLERGKASYDFEEADLREVVQRAMDVYKHRAERESVELVASVPAEPLSANVDKRALELAVMNLVDNALKYAREGGRVEIDAGTLDGGDAFLRVTDFGPGIPQNERSRIFERFFRGATADSTRARGSGIGLSLVRHIAEAHGGRVRVFSPAHPDGRGARFTIELGSRTRRRAADRLSLPPTPAAPREKPTDT